MSEISAIQILNDFKARKTPAAFPNINRQLVADGLFNRMGAAGAGKIDQTYSSLCGPACLMYCYAYHRPQDYMKYVMDLYERGEAQFGTLTVRPGTLCRNYAVDPEKMDPADWIALASLRDSDNRYLSYKDIACEAAGITLPDTMIRWFRALGYSGVHNKTQLFGGFTQTDDHVISAGAWARHGKKVCLFVDDDMMKEVSLRHPSIIPNHWMLITNALGLDTKNRTIQLKVYCWGNDERPAPVSVHGTGSLDEFLKYYYGYVVAG